MFDFQVGEFSYKGRHPETFIQLDLLASISPLMAAGFGQVVGLIWRAKRDGIQTLGEESLKTMGDLLTPVAREFSEMRPETRRFIFSTCFSVLERRATGKANEAFAPIWNVTANRCMFDDINSSLPTQLKIVANTIDGLFADFFPFRVSTFLNRF